MEKTLLEMVEEMASKPVSDRPAVPMADKEQTSEDQIEEDEEADHREEFNRLLIAAVRSPKSSG